MTNDREEQRKERLAAIRAAIAPVLRAHAVELADLAWASGPTLRVTIERPLPAGTPWRPELGFGVNLDDCAEVSRDVSNALDADEALIPHAYSLEVSSPGLDRPLHGPTDFTRFIGALAKVKLRAPAADGQRVLRGTLLAAPEGAVALLVDGKRLEAPIDDVAEAQLVFELDQGPKPSGKRAVTGASAAKPKGAKAAPAKRAGGPSAR